MVPWKKVLGFRNMQEKLEKHMLAHFLQVFFWTVIFLEKYGGSPDIMHH
jgi:hypothetical protein